MLQSNIKEFGPIRGQEYVDRMEWLIEQTWETIYNYYKLIKKEHKERLSLNKLKQLKIYLYFYITERNR